MSIRILNPKTCQTDEDVRKKIIEISGEEEPDVLFPVPGYATAFIGLRFCNETEKFGVVLSREEMCYCVMREDRITREEALEFLEFNTFNAFVGGGEYAEPMYINTGW